MIVPKRGSKFLYFGSSENKSTIPITYTVFVLFVCVLSIVIALALRM